MIEKGLPGERNIIVFDNSASRQNDLAHCGCSYVLEINLSDNNLVRVYDADNFFFSRFTANGQCLPNGNTLILEAMWRRLLEVTPEKEILRELAKRVRDIAHQPEQEERRALWLKSTGWTAAEYPSCCG
jgi:hypothetical protein